MSFPRKGSAGKSVNFPYNPSKENRLENHTVRFRLKTFRKYTCSSLKKSTVIPRTYATPQLHYPQLRYFRSYAILNWVQKIRVTLFCPRVTLFSSFSPQLHYLFPLVKLFFSFFPPVKLFSPNQIALLPK